MSEKYNLYCLQFAVFVQNVAISNRANGLQPIGMCAAFNRRYIAFCDGLERFHVQ